SCNRPPVARRKLVERRTERWRRNPGVWTAFGSARPDDHGSGDEGHASACERRLPSQNTGNDGDGSRRDPTDQGGPQETFLSIHGFLNIGVLNRSIVNRRGVKTSVTNRGG